jgi:hypothetical protein
MKSAVHMQDRYRSYIFFVRLGVTTGWKCENRGWRVGNTKIGEAIVALWVPDSQSEVGTFKRVDRKILKSLEVGAAGVPLRQGCIVENLINSQVFTIYFVFKRPKLQIR